MRINEVETIVGITKKNIRFYEEQGLLEPKRNLENGYRNYNESDVRTLQIIKVFRKLGISIEDIKMMLSGRHTLKDGMRRHLVSLERERKNLDQSVLLCKELEACDDNLNTLDVKELMSKIENMEKEGTTFLNKHKGDVKVRYVAPIIVTLVMMVMLLCLMWVIYYAYQFETPDRPPLGFIIFIIGVLICVGIGTVVALIERIKEIGKGESDEARRY